MEASFAEIQVDKPTLSYGKSPFSGNVSVLGSSFHTAMDEAGWPMTGRRDGRPTKGSTIERN